MVILPKYYNDGNDFISQNREKNGVFNFYWGDDEKSFLKNLKVRKDNWHYSDKKVEYTLNSYGYRTKEFNEINWKESIVIFGCSIIFGEGVSDDETLSYFLEKFSGRNVINMGVSGCSNQFILDTILVLIKKYGYPYSVIVAWTGIARTPFYNFNGVNHLGHWVDESDKNMVELYRIMYTEDTHAVITSKNIIENVRLLLKNNTKYIDCSFIKDNSYYTNLLLFDIIDKARDLGHPGHKTFEKSANRLFLLLNNQKNII